MRDNEQEARILFQQGSKIKGIARMLRVSERTVKRWKQKYEWELSTSESELRRITIEDRLMSILAYQIDTLESMQEESRQYGRSRQELLLNRDLEGVCKLYSSVKASRIHVYNHKKTLESFLRYLTRKGQKTEHLAEFVTSFLDEKIMAG